MIKFAYRAWLPAAFAVACASPSGPRSVSPAQDTRSTVPINASTADALITQLDSPTTLPRVDDARYAGYQVVNGQRRALPIGSSLDAAQGIFYWQPAAGFLGSQQLEFVAGTNGVPVRVRAVVGTSVQAVIDIPTTGSVDSTLTVAGWAIDLAATTGTGVDAVHVWAHPTDGAAPIFLGVASYGEARPDIGALFGEQFTGAAYSLDAFLAPGSYDIVVYPHSAVLGDFHGAQAVRVRMP